MPSPQNPAGRLLLPPATAATRSPPAGREAIEIGGTFAGLCYVPPGPPRRFAVMLHGAGGTAEQGLGLLLPYADAYGLMLYAPKSTGVTWDLLRGGYGTDVTRLQAALTQLAVAAPPMIGGFSDGGSYALSLALGNGDVFPEVLAFSPGFAAPAERIGRPRVYISHGRQDRVLPIERCGRRLARVLRAEDYDVEYQEFDGGHLVPPRLVVAALEWVGLAPAGSA
jgi:phospholipase/carboxylesterase